MPRPRRASSRLVANPFRNVFCRPGAQARTKPRRRPSGVTGAVVSHSIWTRPADLSTTADHASTSGCSPKAISRRVKLHVEPPPFEAGILLMALLSLAANGVGQSQNILLRIPMATRPGSPRSRSYDNQAISVAGSKPAITVLAEIMYRSEVSGEDSW